MDRFTDLDREVLPATGYSPLVDPGVWPLKWVYVSKRLHVARIRRVHLMKHLYYQRWELW